MFWNSQEFRFCSLSLLQPHHCWSWFNVTVFNSLPSNAYYHFTESINVNHKLKIDAISRQIFHWNYKWKHFALSNKQSLKIWNNIDWLIAYVNGHMVNTHTHTLFPQLMIIFAKWLLTIATYQQNKQNTIDRCTPYLLYVLRSLCSIFVQIFPFLIFYSFVFTIFTKQDSAPEILRRDQIFIAARYSTWGRLIENRYLISWWWEKILFIFIQIFRPLTLFPKKINEWIKALNVDFNGNAITMMFYLLSFVFFFCLTVGLFDSLTPSRFKGCGSFAPQSKHSIKITTTNSSTEMYSIRLHEKHDQECACGSQC